MLIESRPALDPELAVLVMAQRHELRQAGTGLAGSGLAGSGLAGSGLAGSGLAGEALGGRQIALPHDDAQYLAVVVQGRVVACGAWQALEPGVAEIKRMYVRPAFRGRGIARQLVVALEEEALAAGRTVIRLETGTRVPAAIGLYRSAGYRQIPAFGEYLGDPFSVCFEKRLAVSVQ